MKFDTDLPKPDTIYHIYNRGLKRVRLFYEERNYDYFMDRLCYHTAPVADLFGWCLLRNHFHLLMRMHSQSRMEALLDKPCPNPCHEISRRFSNFFNGYTQAINKAIDRKGGLFESPYRRKQVKSAGQLVTVLTYLHVNPDHHRMRHTYETYPYSSFWGYNPAAADPRIVTTETLNAFGGYEAFLAHHKDVAARKRVR